VYSLATPVLNRVVHLDRTQGLKIVNAIKGLQTSHDNEGDFSASELFCTMLLVIENSVVIIPTYVQGIASRHPQKV
jgi:hypothetical protein